MRPAIDRFFIREQQEAKCKRTNLWKAMRMLRRFTVHDLMTVCNTENRRSVLTYLGQLRRAGFVKIVDVGHQGRHIPKTFFVIRDSGPLAPALLAKRTSMFDPNTHQEHAIES
jgi:hypothetical protein